MSYQGKTSIQRYTIKKIFVGKIGIENNISLGNCNRIEDSSLKSPKLRKTKPYKNNMLGNKQELILDGVVNISNYLWWLNKSKTLTGFSFCLNFKKKPDQKNPGLI